MAALWRRSKATRNDQLWFLSVMTCLPNLTKSTNADQCPYNGSSIQEYEQTACWTEGALFDLLLGLHLFLQPSVSRVYKGMLLAISLRPRPQPAQWKEDRSTNWGMIHLSSSLSSPNRKQDVPQYSLIIKFNILNICSICQMAQWIEQFSKINPHPSSVTTKVNWYSRGV